MATVKKMRSTSISAVFMHNNRTDNDGITHTNEGINPEKTFMNYFLLKGSKEDLDMRLSEVFVPNKKDQVQMCEICVTMPKDVKKEDERPFFRAVYDFYCKEFGEKNIINAVVHKDETRPHLHLDFVPVVKGEPEFKQRYKLAFAKWREEKGVEDDNVERLCCKEVINREYLNTMHPRLSKAVSDYLGYSCEIINGATANGNKKVLELKAESLKEEIEKQERNREVLAREMELILSVAKQSGLTKYDMGILPLMQKIADLENQVAVYKSIITNNRYPFSKQELEQLKSKRYIPSMSSNINIYDGNLTEVEITNDAIVVIELYNKTKRELPQQDYIDKNSELYQQVRLAFSSSSLMFARNSRTDDKTYLFLKTDSTKDTLTALLELQKRLIDEEEKWAGRRIYMEQISNDTLHIARAILLETEYKATYLTGKRQTTEKEGKEQTLQKTE